MLKYLMGCFVKCYFVKQFIFCFLLFIFYTILIRLLFIVFEEHLCENNLVG